MPEQSVNKATGGESNRASGLPNRLESVHRGFLLPFPFPAVVGKLWIEHEIVSKE